MYLVNKETGKVHAYFRKTVESPPEWADESFYERNYVSGRYYLATEVSQDDALTLEDFQNTDFSDDPVDWKKSMYELLDCRDRRFTYMHTASYVSEKLYRIIIRDDQLDQLYDDFSNNDLFELQFFSAALFALTVDEKCCEYAISEWDKYGILDRLSQVFYIAGDDREDIYNCSMIVDREGYRSK
jgi:hypothetical protein